MSLPAPHPPAFTQDDLRWLVCPACRNTLHIDGVTIVCSSCDRRYPIVDGIPVLLVDRAIE